jgi:hypothetical protein
VAKIGSCGLFHKVSLMLDLAFPLVRIYGRLRSYQDVEELV